MKLFLDPAKTLAAAVAVLLMAPVGPAAAKSPPIDCSKARTVVEKAICASPSDVALDGEVAALYDRGLAEFSPDDRHALAQSQLKFVHARAGCEWAAHRSAHPGTAIEECARSKMEERVRSLRRTVDHGGYRRR